MREKKRLSRVLKGSEGYTYIEVIIGCFVSCLILALALELFRVGADYLKIDYFTKTMAENAKTSGIIDTDSDDYTQLAREAGLDPGSLTYTWDAQYFDEASSKLAFKQTFTLKVSYQEKIALGDIGSVSFPLKHSESERSDIYWK